MTSSPRHFDTFAVGQQASTGRHFDHDNVSEWSQMAGLDQPWPQVPEPLIAGLFSYLLGEQLPGHGTNYLKQNMHFAAAAHIGEHLTATVSITRLRADKSLVYLDTLCTGEDGRVICSGDALVLFQH